MGSLSPLTASLHPHHLEGLRAAYAAGHLSGLIPGGGKQWGSSPGKGPQRLGGGRLPWEARVSCGSVCSTRSPPEASDREEPEAALRRGSRTPPLLPNKPTLQPSADPKHSFPLLESRFLSWWSHCGPSRQGAGLLPSPFGRSPPEQDGRGMGGVCL